MKEMYGSTQLRNDFEGFEGIFMSKNIYNILRHKRLKRDDIFDEDGKCTWDLQQFEKIPKIGTISLQIIKKYFYNEGIGKYTDDLYKKEDEDNTPKKIEENKQPKEKMLADIVMYHLSKNKPIEFDVLGTTYTLFFRAEEDLKVSNKTKDGKRNGYCRLFDPYITIYVSRNHKNNMVNENKIRHVMRHEIIHAFIHESGLGSQSHSPVYGWGNDEEIIDWFAAQYPKMYPIFEKLNLLHDIKIAEIKEDV